MMLAGVAVFVSGAFPSAALQRPAPGPSIRSDQHFAVRAAFDGDTLYASGAGRVRLLGIDAPELGAGLDTPAPFAREAQERLAALVVGRWVRFETDGENRDTYKRLLAYVIRDDGLFVNAAVVRAGLARVSARRQLRRLSELRAAETEAQRGRRGMWGARPEIRGLRRPGAGDSAGSDAVVPCERAGIRRWRDRQQF